jgi:UPF0755 protein
MNARRKSGIVGIVILAFLVLVAVIAVVGGYWLFLSANAATGNEVVFELPSGASTAQVAEKLESAGVINSALVFRLRVRLAGADAQLLAGTYRLTPGTSYDQIIRELQAGPPREVVTITSPEGKTIPQTAEILAESLDFEAGEFIEYATSAASDYVGRFPFLEGAFNGSMEGFLFPDTYEFMVDSIPDDVVASMVKRFSDVWVTLGDTKGPATAMTTAQLVTVASLVEREAALADERPLVASVIYNRLDKNMRLQMCSSVQFLLPLERQNVLRLTNADLAIDSPYNTYKNAGLPPGPIANPGRAALEAAFRPKNTKYIYFVLTGKDGSQTFAATLDEFNKAKEKSKKVFGE